MCNGFCNGEIPWYVLNSCHNVYPPTVAMELGSGSATDPTNVTDLADPNDSIDSFDRIRNIVVGGVIGAGSLLTLGIFIVCGILHCYFTSDKG